MNGTTTHARTIAATVTMTAVEGTMIAATTTATVTGTTTGVTMTGGIEAFLFYFVFLNSFRESKTICLMYPPSFLLAYDSLLFFSSLSPFFIVSFQNMRVAEAFRLRTRDYDRDRYDRGYDKRYDDRRY